MPNLTMFGALKSPTIPLLAIALLTANPEWCMKETCPARLFSSRGLASLKSNSEHIDSINSIKRLLNLTAFFLNLDTFALRIRSTPHSKAISPNNGGVPHKNHSQY